ncbi:oligosaccharide flippase family protein [Verrucomicrobia bacterium]|nr:oligosaccharide flippase family protein [Verrucomicrobiota bacterium]
MLATGTTSAQCLLLLVTPLLTRLYTLESFGQLAIYSSILALVSAISCLRYELAIPLGQTDDEVNNTVSLCFLLLLLTTLIVSILILLLQTYSVLGVKEHANYIWMLPIGLWLTGSYNIISSWCTQKKKFKAMSSTRLKQSVATVIIQLVAFNEGIIALIIGQIIGQSYAVLKLTNAVNGFHAIKKVSWVGICDMAVKHKRFPLFSNWSSLINVASQQMIPLSLPYFFSTTLAGYYYFANRVMMTPAALIGKAVSSVFYANTAEKKANGTLDKFFLEIQHKLTILGSLPLFLIILYGPELFGAILGNDMTYSGTLARWLAIPVYLSFIVSPTSTVFSTINRQDISLKLQILLATVKIIALSTMLFGLEFLIAIKILCFASTFGYFMFIVFASRCLNIPILNFFQSVYEATKISSLLSSPLIILKLCGSELFSYYGIFGCFLILLICVKKFKTIFNN